MDTFEEFGDWWIPKNPERTISGRVEYSPSSGVKLYLKGALVDENGSFGETFLEGEVPEIPLVYGELNDGREVTIRDAVQTSRSFGSGPTTEEYVSHCLFAGVHSSTNQLFEKIRFDIQELPDWMNASAVKPLIDLSQINESDVGGDVEAAYAITSPKSYITEHGEIEVNLKSSHSTTSNLFSLNIDTVGALEIASEQGKRYDELLDFAFVLLRFVSFGLGAGTFPSKISLYEFEEERQRPVEAYHQIPNYRDDVKVNRPYSFRPSDIDVADSIQAWLDHREEAPVVHDHHDMLLHGPSLTPRLKFMTIVIALEAYHEYRFGEVTYISEEEYSKLKSEILGVIPGDSKVHDQMYGLLEHVVNEPSLKDKLSEIVETEAGILENFMDIETTLSNVRDHRHNIAHGLEQVDVTTVHHLSKKLYLILETVLMRDIGVPEDVVANAMVNKYRGL